MEAAIRLPITQVYVHKGRLTIDQLVVDDETAVRLAGERDDPARFVVEAIEIGARVLDRELTGANAEFVRAEFEKTARELDASFVERARRVAERLDEKVDEVFGPEHGHVTKVLARHFGDESSVAVQHRMKAVLDEVAVRMREDLRKQFSADSDVQPAGGLSERAPRRDAPDRRPAGRAPARDGREARGDEARDLRAALREGQARGDRGGRRQGDREGALLRGGGRAGDRRDRVARRATTARPSATCAARAGARATSSSRSTPAPGPARGRIVFEAKNSQLSRNKALAELDEALETRGADFAIFVVPSEDKLPARTRPLREFNGDKMFVVYDAEDDARLALEVAYALARARVLMNRGAVEAVDPAAVRAEVERALGAMEDVRRIKTQLTNASGGIDAARQLLDIMAAGVRGAPGGDRAAAGVGGRGGVGTSPRSSRRARGAAGAAAAAASLSAVTRSVIFDCDGVLVDSELISNTVLAGLLTGPGCRRRSRTACATTAAARWSRHGARRAAQRGRTAGRLSRRATTPRSRRSSRASSRRCPG